MCGTANRGAYPSCQSRVGATCLVVRRADRVVKVRAPHGLTSHEAPDDTPWVPPILRGERRQRLTSVRRRKKAVNTRARTTVATAETVRVLRGPSSAIMGPPSALPSGTTPLDTPCQATAPAVNSLSESSCCSSVVDAAGYGA